MISLHQSPSTNVHPAPLITPSFLQALTILQMPILELSSWMQKKLEENPLVEILYENFPPPSNRVIKTQRVVEQRDCYKEISLHEALETQARLCFKDPQELSNALALLASLDERGFLPKDTPSDPIVSALQSFDPPGICARSLQESLLLQLKSKGKQQSLAFTIIQNHFEDLLHRRFTKIRKTARCTSEEFYDVLQTDIATLSFNPASHFSSSETVLSIPDLYLREEDGIWRVEINESHLPRIKLRKELISKETEAYFRASYKEAHHLLLAVRRRSTTLLRLGRLLLKTQHSFLEGSCRKPHYLTIKEVAAELKLHPATIARVIANKMISCDHYGILPLKFFFCRPSEPVHIGDKIAALISQENAPLSDEEIARQIRACGIPCARRTIAKYRKRLNINPISIRKLKA